MAFRPNLFLVENSDTDHFFRVTMMSQVRCGPVGLPDDASTKTVSGGANGQVKNNFTKSWKAKGCPGGTS
jgi:hypothetical protein